MLHIKMKAQRINIPIFNPSMRHLAAVIRQAPWSAAGEWRVPTLPGRSTA
jgi:hypothetical protein